MDLIALLIVIGLVLMNGFFVATEFAVVKVRPARIEQMVKQGRPGARAVPPMLNRLDGILAATQLGISLASLAFGKYGHDAFAGLSASMLGFFGFDDPVWIDRSALAISFALITAMHLVVGEIAPKTLAIARSETVAVWVAYPMQAFYWFFYPFVTVLNRAAALILIPFGVRAPGGHDPHSEEEIEFIVNQARRAGLLSMQRGELLTKVMNFSSKTAKQLMVARNEVVFMDTNLSLEENLERAFECGHSRFPLCDRDLDEVYGIVTVREVLHAIRIGSSGELLMHAEPVAFFPELMSAERLLAEFRARRIQMAVVVDEYGGAAGIITPADVVTAVMGEFDDHDDDDVVALPGGVYEVDGTTPLEEIAEVLKTEFETEDMRTIAGFLMEHLGRLPRTGDRVTHGGFMFEVTEVQGPRVRQVLIQRAKAPAAPPAPIVRE